MLSAESLEQFKKLYLQEFGEELSDAEATQKAEQLVHVYVAVYDRNTDAVAKLTIAKQLL